MKPSELEALIQQRLDPDARIHDMTDNGGYGLVRWSRRIHPVVGGEKSVVEHIVHRWATKDTDGVERWPEGHFYSGAYYEGPEGEQYARTEYLRREDPAPEYSKA